MSDFLSQFNEKYGKVYANWVLLMLTSPRSIVEKTRMMTSERKIGRILLTIVVSTVFIGITIGTLIPNRPAIASRAVVFLVLSLLWIFLSMLVHFFSFVVLWEVRNDLK